MRIELEAAAQFKTGKVENNVAQRIRAKFRDKAI
jgi:hypothetical protein